MISNTHPTHQPGHGQRITPAYTPRSSTPVVRRPATVGPATTQPDQPVLQALQRRLGNLAIVGQVAQLVWIGAKIVELLEAGVGLCGPRVVTIAEVDAPLFPNTLVWRDVLGTRFGRQVPTRLPAALYVECRAPRGVVSWFGIGYPQEAAPVHEGRHARARDVGERGRDIVVAD